jgi:hypothetical protein
MTNDLLTITLITKILYMNQLRLSNPNINQYQLLTFKDQNFKVILQFILQKIQTFIVEIHS